MGQGLHLQKFDGFAGNLLNHVLNIVGADTAGEI